MTVQNLTYTTRNHRRQGGDVQVLRYDSFGNAGMVVAENELWGNCPLLNWLLDPSIGVHLIEDWQTYQDSASVGDYVLTQATTGTGAISTAATGVLELDCNSTTQGQGAQIQRTKSAWLPAADKHLWFECKIKVVDTFDKIQFFAGLSEIDTTLIASGANTSANHIGFEIATTGAGVVTSVAEKAGNRETTTGVTLTEATYVRLGFYVQGVTSITFYVNGAAVGSALTTAAVPVVALYPSFVCQTDDTNDPILHIAGYRVFQLR